MLTLRGLSRASDCPASVQIALSDLHAPATIKHVKQELLKHLPPGDVTLYLRGQKLKSSVPVASLQLLPGEFLAWVLKRSDAVPLPALRSAASREQPADDAQPDAIAQEPVSPRLDTLLPGYASRPQPSPAKTRRHPVPVAQASGPPRQPTGSHSMPAYSTATTQHPGAQQAAASVFRPVPSVPAVKPAALPGAGELRAAAGVLHELFEELGHAKVTDRQGDATPQQADPLYTAHDRAAKSRSTSAGPGAEGASAGCNSKSKKQASSTGAGGPADRTRPAVIDLTQAESGAPVSLAPAPALQPPLGGSTGGNSQEDPAAALPPEPLPPARKRQRRQPTTQPDLNTRPTTQAPSSADPAQGVSNVSQPAQAGGTVRAARKGMAGVSKVQQESKEAKAASKAARLQEAVLTSLPLPPQLEALHAKFCVLTSSWKLLMKQHVQPTFKTLGECIASASGGAMSLQLEELSLLAQLCPSVLYVHDRSRPHAETDLGSAVLAPGNTHQGCCGDHSAVHSNVLDPARPAASHHWQSGPGPESGSQQQPSDSQTAVAGSSRQHRAGFEDHQGAAHQAGGGYLCEAADTDFHDAGGAHSDGLGSGWDPDDGGGLFSRIASQGWTNQVVDRATRKQQVAVGLGGAEGVGLDGCGAVAVGEAWALVVDLRDPGHWRNLGHRDEVAAGATAGVGAAAGSKARDAAPPGSHTGGENSRQQGAHPGAGCLVRGSGQPGGHEAAQPGLYPWLCQAPQGALGRNMEDRCRASVRRALVAAVGHLHWEWAQQHSTDQHSTDQADAASEAEAGASRSLRAATARSAQAEVSAADWDPVVQQQWHPVFMIERFESISCEDVKAVVPRMAVAEVASSGDDDKVVGVGGVELSHLGRAAPAAPRLLKRDQACTSLEKLKTEAFADHLKQLGWYDGQVVHVESMAAREARYAQPQQPLSAPVLRALQSLGLSRLYSHQAMAVDALRRGQHVVVSTSTASGKSLCYNIAVMEALVADPQACAIYIFPTKALAQDQLRALRSSMTAAFGDQAPEVHVYDGDTPQHERPEIRNKAQLLITNPDMLHRSVLPFHAQFKRLLSHLKVVVLDEGHAYHGVFGAHTAMVMRRLRRLCEGVYHCEPRFCVTSATIANPHQHACRLVGVSDVVLVSEDGSPTGPKQFVLWNPPLSFGRAPPATKPTSGVKRKSSGGVTKQEGAATADAQPGAVAVVREDVAEEDGAEGDGRGTKRHKKAAERMAARQALREARAMRYRGIKLTEGAEEWAAAAGAGAQYRQLSDQLFGSLSPLAQRRRAAKTGMTVDDSGDPDQQHREGGGGSGGGDGGGGDRTPQADNDVAAEHGHQAPANAAAIAPATGRGGQPGSATSGQSQQQLLRSALQALKSASREPLHLRSGQVATSGNNTLATTSTHPQSLSDLAEEVLLPERDVRPVITLSSGWRLPKRHVHPAAHTHAAPYTVGQQTAQGSEAPVQQQRRGKGKVVVKQEQAQEGDGAAAGLSSVQVAKRMPSKHAWKEAKAVFGPAGTPEDLRRDSPIVELSLLLAECIQHGLRTIAFCKTRKLSELVGAYTRETLKTTAPDMAPYLKVYRGGYSPKDRRDIEQGLHEGRYIGVAATNALELGVDIGGLDVTLHLGFQGSLASLRQQAGRAGRREQSSLSIYVAFDSPLDQYFMSHPAELFQKPVEQAQETGAALVQAGLLQRMPKWPGPHAPLCYVGPSEVPAADVSLRTIDDTHFDIVLEGGGQVLEQVEMSNVFYEVYDGAIYMFQGRPFLCKKLDIGARVAIVRPVDVKYYTKIRDMKDVYVTGGNMAYGPTITGHTNDPTLRPPVPLLPTAPLTVPQPAGDTDPDQAAASDRQDSKATAAPQQAASTSVSQAAPCGTEQDVKPDSTTAGQPSESDVAALCQSGCVVAGSEPQCEPAIVTVRYLGFHRVWQGTGQVFDSVDLWLPDVRYETQAAYVRLPAAARHACAAEGLSYFEGIHAASHAVLNVLPLFVICTPHDVGSECLDPYDTRYHPERILLYDKHPGGIGIAQQAAPLFPQLLRRALALVDGCKCTYEKGCPACVHCINCNHYNAVLNKKAGLVVLKSLLRCCAQ